MLQDEIEYVVPRENVKSVDRKPVTVKKAAAIRETVIMSMKMERPSPMSIITTTSMTSCSGPYLSRSHHHLRGFVILGITAFFVKCPNVVGNTLKKTKQCTSIVHDTMGESGLPRNSSWSPLREYSVAGARMPKSTGILY